MKTAERASFSETLAGYCKQPATSLPAPLAESVRAYERIHRDALRDRGARDLDNPAYVSEREAAWLLHIAAETLRGWRGSGDAPPHIRVTTHSRWRIWYALHDLAVFAALRSHWGE